MQLPSTRDAITQTKANPQRRRQWNTHGLNAPRVVWEGKPRRLRGLRVDYSSEARQNTDEEDEEEELEFNPQRAQNGNIREPGHAVITQQHRADR